MYQPDTEPWDPKLHVYAIGNELRHKLRSLIDNARFELKPRDFAERHLVDELAMCKWRHLRVLAMQTAIYRHLAAKHIAKYGPVDPDVQRPRAELDPAHDMYFYAMCHAPDQHGVVLAALARLETRYHRHFCNSLRLLTWLRRQNPLPKPETVN
jgi:hypothetical protein